jgi:hypothetical protein
VECGKSIGRAAGCDFLAAVMKYMYIYIYIYININKNSSDIWSRNMDNDKEGRRTS